MKINVKITDNYKSLNPKKGLIYKVKNFIKFPEKRLIVLSNIKRKLSFKFIKNKIKGVYMPRNLLVHGNDHIFLDNLIQKLVDNEYEKYKEIKQIRKGIYKEIKLNSLRILEDISKTTGSYNWNIHIEFNTSSNKNINQIYFTKVLLNSLDNDLLKGELLIKKDDYLSFSKNARTPLRNGAINIFDEHILEALKDKLTNYEMVIEPHDQKDYIGIEKIDIIHSRIGDFFNLKEGISINLWFISPIVLISKDINWKFTAMTINYMNGLQNYFNNKDNSYLSVKNQDFLSDIYYSIMNISDDHYIDNISHINKIKNSIEGLNLKSDISDEEVVQMFELLELIDY